MGRRPLLDRLIEGPVATAEAEPELVKGELRGPERGVVEGAAPTRVMQFTAGRVCARRALEKLGAPGDLAIASGEAREPIWPSGYAGSITHTRAWCAVAVGRRVDFRSIGVDVEPATPLKASLVSRVCRPEERVWIERAHDAGLLGKVVFSAKEAVYKCQFPITGEYLGFHAVSVVLEDHRFVAVFERDTGPFRRGESIAGRYLIEDGLVATACVLRADE